CARTNYAMDYW
nr:immunoglobulin heavy chain junction region [Mus musculus]